MSHSSMESTEGHHEAAAEIAPSPPLPTSASRTNARPKREIPVAAPRVEEENGGREQSRRTRRRTSRFEFDGLDNEEQKLIQQAIKNSKKETKREERTIPMAPTYYPSAEEWRDPFQYITKIRPDAEQYGICKIVPPVEWNPPCLIDMHSPKKFPTRRQAIHTLQEGERGFDDGKEYDIASYKVMADAFAKQWSEDHYAGQDVPLELLAKDYWDCVETGNRKPEVEYGNDLDTSQYQSGFHPKLPELSGIETGRREEMFTEEYYKRTGWNLNNIAATDGSVLKYLKTEINGVNVPWLYVGMLFTSFCWHNEDNYLYSINYNHMGSVKQWYGVPGEQAKHFDKVAKDFLWESFQESPDLLHHMTTQISPSLLASNNIPVCQARHEPRTFLITFPKAYHCGFSYGFNVGEAVNFATSDWLTYGSDADERYRKLARQSVFSHQRLLFTLLNHKQSLLLMEKPQFLIELTNEILKVLDEEIESRPYIFQNGVRDISDKVQLPPNSFDAIDSTAAEYDDMRGCYLCKHICVFSAIACECDRTKVVCIRHYHVLCQCAKEKKYMLEWASSKDLKALRAQLRQGLHDLTQQSKKLSRDRDHHGQAAAGQGSSSTHQPQHRQPSSSQSNPALAPVPAPVATTSSSALPPSISNSTTTTATSSSSSSNNNHNNTTTTSSNSNDIPTNSNNSNNPSSPSLAPSQTHPSTVPSTSHIDNEPTKGTNASGQIQSHLEVKPGLEVKPSPSTDAKPGALLNSMTTVTMATLEVNNEQTGVNAPPHVTVEG